MAEWDHGLCAGCLRRIGLISKWSQSSLTLAARCRPTLIADADRLFVLRCEIEAHEAHRAEWDDQIAWLTHLQWLNRTYLRLRLPTEDEGTIDG